MTATSRKVDPSVYMEVVEFLNYEARLLDNNFYKEWLACLDEGIDYTMPVRTNIEREAGLGFETDMHHFDETFASLKMRVMRLETEYAWAEDPPSRTRRFVTNVHAEQLSESELAVESYLLLMRNRWDITTYQILSAERRDVLRSTDDGLKIAKREILVDQTSLGTDNLGVFL